jgi:hypothetical protein
MPLRQQLRAVVGSGWSVKSERSTRSAGLRMVGKCMMMARYRRTRRVRVKRLTGKRESRILIYQMCGGVTSTQWDRGRKSGVRQRMEVARKARSACRA